MSYFIFSDFNEWYGDTWSANAINVRLEILGGYWNRFPVDQREFLTKCSAVAVVQEGLG